MGSLDHSVDSQNCNSSDARNSFEVLKVLSPYFMDSLKVECLTFGNQSYALV